MPNVSEPFPKDADSVNAEMAGKETVGIALVGLFVPRLFSFIYNTSSL